jgi:UDP-N-acetylglucosamine--N-acetylmuramyl-(pentapeptide) pyrophosphoryl-undecaprenol N-acetylglucosamine transferase
VTDRGAFEFLGLKPDVPVLFVIGGSSGAQIINNCILEALPELVEKYQIIHQTGKVNYDGVVEASQVILENSENKDRYHPMAFLSPLHMRMSGGAAALVISRAGSQIFEIASWGVPSIIIPITNSNNDHQRKNAYSYAYARAIETP